MATETQIKTEIKKQLNSFNVKKVSINDDTVISSALGGKERGETLFRGNVLWALDRNKHVPSSGGKNRFPNFWRDMSVKGLAEKLVLLVIVSLLSFTASSQVTFNIGTAKSELRNGIINFGFSYIESKDSVLNQYYQLNGKSSYFTITPNIKVQSGTSDALNGLTAKATGLFTSFKTTTVDGWTSVNADRTMHVFPVSLGAETNNQFTFINGIAEVGYEPYWQSPLHKGAKVLEYLNWGVWLQAGKKWYTNADSAGLKGGAMDESKETNSILRAKSSLTIDSKRLVDIQGLGIGLVGDGALWYDMLHNQFYYRVNGTARIFLTNTTYFDLFYQKGSGAPNFNTGDQFGAGLTVTF